MNQSIKSSCWVFLIKGKKKSEKRDKQANEDFHKYNYLSDTSLAFFFRELAICEGFFTSVEYFNQCLSLTGRKVLLKSFSPLINLYEEGLSACCSC